MGTDATGGGKKKDQTAQSEATYLKALSLLGETGTGSNTACIDVADGKIVRVRPLHYDWKQDTSDLTPQILEARGQVLGGRRRLFCHRTALPTSNEPTLPTGFPIP